SVFFATMRGRAPSTLRRKMIAIDTWLNWAGPGRNRQNIIPAINVGPDWIKPSTDLLRTSLAESDKTYTPEALAAAFEQVKDSTIYHATTYLGLNCAMLAMDIAMLPESVIDLDDGII